MADDRTKRRWGIAAGGFAGLLAALLAARSMRTEGGGEGVRGQPLFPAVPKLSMPQASGSDRARAGGPALGAAGAKSELEQLLDLFAESKDQPAAEKFAREFKAQPKLEQAFEDFKRDQQSPEPTTTLRAFARDLGGMSDFRRLVSRFAGEPGFREAGAGLLRLPQLKAAVYEQIAALKAEARARGRRGFAAKASRRGGTGRGVSSAAPASRGAAASAAAFAPGASGGLPASVREAEARTQGGGAEGGSGAGSAGPGAHRVGGLGSIQGAGAERDAASAFASLCFKGDPAITPQQCAAIEQYLGEYDLWEACVKAGLYEKCSELCRGKPELQCGEVPSFYDACVSAGEPNCAQRCLRVPGCTPPPPPAPPASPGGTTSGSTSGSTAGSSGPGSEEEPEDPRARACRLRSDSKKDCWWMGYRCCCLWYIISDGKVVGTTGQPGCPQ